MTDELLERVEKRMEDFNFIIEWMMRGMTEMKMSNEATLARVEDKVDANTKAIWSLLDQLGQGPR